MPRALRTCTARGCPNPTEAGRCTACRGETRRASDAKRPGASARGYDRAWERTRADYLRRHSFCAGYRRPCGQPATEADHIDGRGPRGDNSDANLRGYCKPCHSQKTAAEDGAFGRPRRSA